MSGNKRAWKVLGLLCTFGLLAGLIAGPASAKRLSAKQKTAIRAQLRHAVKHNPKAVTRKSFLRKASLVNFKLPVTIRVSQKLGPGGTLVSPNPTNGKNRALIDLGPSLGTRTIGLGGSLPAEIRFHDAYDGGALGNVDLNLLPSGTPGSGLTTTSVPLLANHDVTTAAFGGLGCLGWTGANDPLGVVPGVDAISNLSSADNTPGLNNVGQGPFGIGGPFSGGDVVLRTGPLSLGIADPADFPTGFTLGDPTQTINIGRSGGQANLFGDIPGRDTQIDVTASLVTDINSILREVDAADSLSGAALFNCRQAWTGKIQNVLAGIRLNGTLKISPAILADGKLRIAKASLASAGTSPVSLAACLHPAAAFAASDPSFDPLTSPGPGNSPIDPTADPNPAPTTDCNDPAGISPVLQSLGVTSLSAPGAGSGYTTTEDGSRAVVSGDLDVKNLTAEVLIGADQ